MTSRTVTVLSCILFSIPLIAAVKDFGLREYVYVTTQIILISLDRISCLQENTALGFIT